jgi:hypothetical protein
MLLTFYCNIVANELILGPVFNLIIVKTAQNRIDTQP